MTRRFVTFEGGEGSGKTTQVELLANALMTCGVAVLRTREPGGAPGAELLRDILLSASLDWAPHAETLLHFAARAEHVAKTILPALEAGALVICDRFYDSTMAYQGYGQGADRRFIGELIRLLGVAPALTVVLDVPEAVAQERMRLRGRAADRYEGLGTAFHARVRQGFRQIAEGEAGRCVVVDATGNRQDVHAAVMAAVEARLGALATA